jgi:hypothetical protein
MGQHYVPREYLRGFASDAKRTSIWMFDKERVRWSQAAISKVAQRRGYFSPDIEKQLNVSIERPGNEALRRLRSGDSLSANNAEALISYIGVMLMRVPAKRRRTLAVVPSAIDETVDETEQELRQLMTSDNQARVEAILSEVNSYADLCRRNAATHFASIVENPWPTDSVLASLRSMSWRLVRFVEASPILTSDNPAFFFSAYGIGSPESEVTFPISPLVALLGSRTGIAGTLTTVQGRPALAKEVNRRMIVGAERFVFSNFSFDWASKVAKRKPFELSRMGW